MRKSKWYVKKKKKSEKEFEETVKEKERRNEIIRERQLAREEGRVNEKEEVWERGLKGKRKERIKKTRVRKIRKVTQKKK